MKAVDGAASLSNEHQPNHSGHGHIYVLLVQGILYRATHAFTPWTLRAIPHIQDGYKKLEFKRVSEDSTPEVQEISESELLVYLSFIGMPIDNLWAKNAIHRNIISRGILEVPPEYIQARNDYIFAHYENQYPLCSRVNTLLPEYAIHLGVKHSLAELTSSVSKLTSGRIVFLSLPFVAAALRDLPLDLYTQDVEHAGINPYAFTRQLLGKVNMEELSGDQKLLYDDIVTRLTT